MKLTPLILLLAAGTAFAQNATPDPSAPLGRLFNSAERRAKLDAMRERNVEPGVAAPAETELRLDGIVRTSDGRSTVWVNGVARNDRASVLKIGERSARVATGNGQSIELPVGASVRMVSDDGTR
ncbi:MULTISPECIES: hypothetical protein [Niveibacterium]|uniref:Uncharacterized protein n=1 Tax=Niveibacterium microcysteis TaxID=2811415 RepID=A0ABX7M822_9RHOO|nr:MULTISPECIES: hypothetical protein [Niveibacterium]QSI77904.1 hypothetical protein JY500_04485 [Niveibacterium microcysteis]